MVWNFLIVFIMHISTLECSEELQNVILRTLKDMGVKHRLKKFNVNKYSQLRTTGNDGRLFKKPLHQLQCQKITLDSGCDAEVPTFIIEACKCIEENCGTEGLFRKAGSNARQRQIKTHLDSGGKLGRQHHVIDVANVLKHFFRELPEPLLPYIYHDLFMRCLLLREKKVEAILLTCLLLPSVHLSSLEYIMQFFQKVASLSELNKMDTRNLAIILTPSIMPVDEKMNTNTGTRLGYHVSIVETLLDNASEIGLLPDHIYSQLAPGSHDGSGVLLTSGEEGPKTKKKKKRRSSSFTRVINGFKKMVGRLSPTLDDNDRISSTPDFSTPVMKSTKKRKILDGPTSAFSNKKRQEVLKSLPQGVPLSSVQFTPTPAHCVSRELYLTPQVCVHPNPTTKSRSPMNKPRNRKLFPHKAQDKSGSEIGPDQISTSTSRKKQHSLSSNVREESGWLQKHTASLERRWSTGLWRRKRRLESLDLAVPSESTDIPNLSTSSGDLVFPDAIVNLSDCDISKANEDSKLSSDALEDCNVTISDSVEFVRIPKSEYEAIKNRVSEIENQITREFGNVKHASSDEQVCGTLSVQSAYERTLEEQARLDGTPCQDMLSTDQLARRLSRELRIRRSLDGARPIRSPSARKIGSLRRRSREIEAQKLRRNSWASPTAIVSTASSSALRRGRPNTVLTGLRRPCRRTSSYHGRESSMETIMISSVSNNCVAGNDRFGNLSCNMGQVSSDQHLFSQRRKSVESSVEMSVPSTPQLAEQEHCVVMHQPMVEGGEEFAVVSNGEQWFPAETHLLKTPTVHREAPVTGRASVARIRSENAGMVLERMRLFDNHVGDDISGVLDTPVPINNRSRINCLKGTGTVNSHQHSKMVTAHRNTKNISHTKVTNGTAISNKKKCHTKSPKETARKTRQKQSRSPLSKSAILSSHVTSPKNRLVRKSHSCKVPKSQHSHSRSSKTAHSKPANGEKENLAAVNDQFFRNKIAELHMQKCQDILRKQSHLISSKEVSSPLKVRNRVDVTNVVAGRNNGETKHQTPVPHIKDSLLLRSPSKMLKPYMSSGVAAGRHPITPIKAMTPLHSTPVRRSPRLAQSCL